MKAIKLLVLALLLGATSCVVYDAPYGYGYAYDDVYAAPAYPAGPPVVVNPFFSFSYDSHHGHSRYGGHAGRHHGGRYYGGHHGGGRHR